jgi:TMEM175 potassium channel family protein
MRVRSLVTLCVFAAAALVALKFPLIGLAMCISCLIVYLKPEAPGTSK